MLWVRAAVLVALLAACAPFSSYESARLLAPGRSSVTAAGAVARRHLDGGGFDATLAAFDLIYRRGVTPSAEAGARLAHIEGTGALDGRLTLAFVDLKISLLPDELALQIPIGIGWRQDDLHDLQLQPTLIHTGVLSPRLELDTAAKLIVVADNDDYSRLGKLNLALDLGVRLRSDDLRVELMPEVGIMIEDLTERFGDVGDSILVGVGVAVIFLP